MQQVIIEIENGAPRITVRGCKGKSCKDLTRDLENALGEVRESKATPEMYEKATQKTNASR